VKFFILILFSFLLASCTGSKAEPRTVQGQQEKNLYKALEKVFCPNANDFRGMGIGESENEALVQARANMTQEHFAVKLKSDFDIHSQNIDGVASSYAKSNISQEAKLLNPNDAKLHHSVRQDDKVGVVVCMAKADAAKGFIERQQLVANSLELASNTVLNTEHPKRKNEAWSKTQVLWSEFARIQNLLDGWGIAKASFYEPANEIYSQAREEYKSYCETAKLHWKPGRETDYSSMAFSILSKNLKVEKSSCQGNGILLAYKNDGPVCSEEFGVVHCSCKPSLSLLSCNGTEYLLLDNAVEGTHQKKNFALEKMNDAFKSANFWEKWEKEIKEWSPKCE